MRYNQGNKYFQASSKLIPSAWGVTRKKKKLREIPSFEEGKALPTNCQNNSIL